MLLLLERCLGVCLIGAENKCFVLHLFLEVVAEAEDKAEAGEALEAGGPLDDGADVALDDVREDINEVGTCAPGLASCSA